MPQFLRHPASQPRIEPIPTKRAIPFVYTIGNQESPSLKKYNRYLDTPLNSFPLDETLFQKIPEFKRDTIIPLLSILHLEDDFVYREETVDGVQTGQYLFSTPVPSSNATNSLKVIIIDGLDHQYPNGFIHPVVLADYLWDFFARHKLP
ncbi:MAG: hypothetical protein V3V31_05425 [Methylococcales bacterium]